MSSNTGRLKDKLLSVVSRAGRWPFGRYVLPGLAGLVTLSASMPALALNLYDGSAAGNGLEINLATTLSYTGLYRVNSPSAVLTGVANENSSEGDLNFRHGIVGNLFEAVPVLDIKDGDYGAHFSGELYLNTPYLGTNQNNQPETINPYSIAKNTDFTSATRNVNGENARLLDAFVVGRHDFGGFGVASLKVGQQTLLWGQSLFFASNGIAAGQAPIDLTTADNLANPQTQQIVLPIGQVVATYQAPSGGLTVQGYYQYQWEQNVFEGVGAYFSVLDFYDKGGQRALLKPGEYLSRSPDITPPPQNGQFGLSVQDTFGNYDVGLYALRYDAKAAEIYGSVGQGFGTPTPGGIYAGNYQIAYPRDIQLYGASLSTTIGAANVAGEISGRRNMPLVAVFPGLVVIPASSPRSANAGALYPVGSTMAAQASAIYLSPPLPLDPGGVSFAGELAFNHVISVTANKNQLAKNRQASAAAFEFVVTPTYNDVLPALQITFPIGLEYSVLGRSEIDQTMQHGTGFFTVGVAGTYRYNWVASLTYKDFLGKPAIVYNERADRGYLALNLQYTF